MRAAVKSFLRHPTRRYLLIGLSVYILELGVIVVAQWLGASAIIAVALSFWLGVAVSFLLQKFITFRDTRLHHRVLLPQIIAVSMLILFNFGFTMVITGLLTNLLPAVVIRTIALGITTLWNFYLYQTHIFKTSEGPAR
ncbi:MAG: hypothetical protein JWM00_413 [Candidatus Saccharibacteria bacterium]|nr:hypothetical protein [Candidatus Saccharibacteria bacterium]